MNNMAVVSLSRKSVQVPNETGQILICDIGLKTQLVLESNRITQQKVYGRAVSTRVRVNIGRYQSSFQEACLQFSQQIHFSFFPFPLSSVDPNYPCEVA